MPLLKWQVHNGPGNRWERFVLGCSRHEFDSAELTEVDARLQRRKPNLVSLDTDAGQTIVEQIPVTFFWWILLRFMGLRGVERDGRGLCVRGVEGHDLRHRRHE